MRDMIATLAALLPNAFLVGGAVRDLLLGRNPQDLDLLVPVDPVGAAEMVSCRLGGSCFRLGCNLARAVLPDGSTVDIGLLVGDIDHDLLGRDFTINAMAIPLQEAARGDPNVIDPCGGRQDLARGIVRMTSPDVLYLDPVRLLRGPRIALELGFRLDPDTER